MKMNDEISWTSFDLWILRLIGQGIQFDLRINGGRFIRML